jgi:glycosyltransferase involved in cell wall biosynthesis
VTLKVLTAILFSPRGGSAPVTRSLVRGLREQGCAVTLLAGSRCDLGRHGDARAFYGDVRPVSFDAALATTAPLQFEGPPGTAPMHPSFEERAGAPDGVFASLDDLDYERQVGAWARELERAGAADADVLHLHHLTPINEAAARVAPQVPVVGQLHGTELLMLEKIVAGPPPGWDYAEPWAERLRRWASSCARLIVAPGSCERAAELLEVEPERMTELPNGVDVERFAPHQVDRRGFWTRALVQDPKGWLPGKAEGSVAYDEADVARLAHGTVLLYVGRFTAVKRLDHLIAAFNHARELATAPAALVLVGGHPGEWEGEHPAQTAARLQARDVYLAGWHAHEDLPEFFSAADAVVSAAEREQFGQLLLEGMACGLPAVAVRALGPGRIVEDGRSGWLISTADDDALARTLAEVIERPGERRRRGEAARESVSSRFSWTRVTAQLAALLDEVAAEQRHPPVVEA